MKNKKEKLVIDQENINLGRIEYDICRRGKDKFFRVHYPNTIFHLKAKLKKIARDAKKK